MNKKLFLYFFCTITLSACATQNIFDARKISSFENELQTLEQDAQFDQLMSTLDLNTGAYEFSYKDTGTSVGMKIKKDKKSFGKWVPKNGAANPEGQVVSYRLARFLNMSDIVIPSAYYIARGQMLATFAQMLNNKMESQRWRLENQVAIKTELTKNPNEMLGTFTVPIENAEVAGIANDSENTINHNHPIAGFIQATGPMPSPTAIMLLKGVRTKDKKTVGDTELELARQFSKIMVLDILTGQWDRWSGGNIEGTYDPVTLKGKFIARDNGGSSMAGTYATAKYLPIVSRFDRGQIERLKKLVEYLKADPQKTASLLQMKSAPVSLQKRAQAVLDQVALQVATHGEDHAFFAN